MSWNVLEYALLVTLEGLCGLGISFPPENRKKYMHDKHTMPPILFKRNFRV